jgi:hypothetical protein
MPPSTTRHAAALRIESTAAGGRILSPKTGAPAAWTKSNALRRFELQIADREFCPQNAGKRECHATSSQRTNRKELQK